MQPARCMPGPASNLHLKYKGRLALNGRYNDRNFAHGLFCCCSPYQWQAGSAQLMDAALENHRLEPREDGAARLVAGTFSGSEWLFWNLGSRSTFSFIKTQVIASRQSDYSDDPGKTTHNWIFCYSICSKSSSTAGRVASSMENALADPVQTPMRKPARSNRRSP